MIYADNNASTALAPEVLEAMLPFFGSSFGNPSSAHALGADAAKAVEKAREQVAASLGAKPSEIFFNSGGTEGDNQALRGALWANPKKRHMIVSAVEHSAVRNCAAHLKALGYTVSVIPVDADGNLNEADLFKALRPDTCLVSLMWANNETGVLFPVERLAREVKQRQPGLLFHTDAVQAFGKVPIDLSQGAIDLLSLSGHKFKAPKGVGMLFVRRGVRIEPLIMGGSQEEGMRAGTLNVPGIVGLGAACALAKRQLPDMQNRVKALRDDLEKELLARVPDARVNGAKAHRVPNTSNISFKGIEGEALVTALSTEGICVSTGSACHKGVTNPSPVLMAMQMPKESALGAVRFSFGHGNSPEELATIVKILPGAVAKLRAVTTRVA